MMPFRRRFLGGALSQAHVPRPQPVAWTAWSRTAQQVELHLVGESQGCRGQDRQALVGQVHVVAQSCTMPEWAGISSKVAS